MCLRIGHSATSSGVVAYIASQYSRPIGGDGALPFRAVNLLISLAAEVCLPDRAGVSEQGSATDGIHKFALIDLAVELAVDVLTPTVIFHRARVTNVPRGGLPRPV